MRRLAGELGIQAPSLYKHLSGKAEMIAWLVQDGLFEAGDVCHAAVDEPGARGPVHALLARYRELARAAPHCYRLITGFGSVHPAMPVALRVWSGEPFWRATGEPHLAQALWAFAHGTAVLEIDAQFLAPAELDRTWQAGADAFAAAAPVERVGAGTFPAQLS